MPAKTAEKARIGVLGASGYTGSELVRLLLRHPRVEIALLTADRRAGQTGAEDTSIGDLEAALGARMTPVLAATRDRLQEMAQSVSRDIAINRLVLRRAVESGEGFVRAICGAERRTMTYDAGARSVAQSTNRRPTGQRRRHRRRRSGPERCRPWPEISCRR
jgi:hypothetical protein